ncbi:peptide ABC transporter substrate-binding protein [Gandjariella thermophila]|uniref:Peptide ABC transporter substrate-binding protein n=2 Tax=Gandjariella thermophila TaxID=1931992 RepID=A0A4D4IVX0_9PSEU|nr:peptide ABC transporter substrate-binding protein [Gandjariella thermophila]
MRPWGTFAGMVGAVAVALAAVTAPTGQPPAHAEQGAALRVALTTDVDSLNPFLATLAASTELGRLMYEFLTTYSAKDQSPVPALAERWTTAPDNLTWTFTIRSGAVWSDGVPITARDVAYTFNLMLTNPVARTANGNFVANFDSVSAPDDRTVLIRTKTPQATMLALDVPIVPEHVWSKVTDLAGYANDTTPVVGSGPFVLADYKPNQYIKLTANKKYWRGPAKIDELDFVSYKNADAAVQALRKGEVDLVNRLTPDQFDGLRGQTNIAVHKAQGRRFTELLLNPGAATRTGEPIGDGHPALRDVRVRRAIAQAIDVRTLVDKVFAGYAEPGSGYIPSVFQSYHWEPPAGTARRFDLAAAGRALDEAGYPRGPDGIRRGADGRPLALRLVGHNNVSSDAQVADYLKRWLADIGIAVDVQMLSGNRLNEVTAAGDYDMAFSGWGVNPDPDAVLGLQTCGQRPGPDGKGGTTDSFFCDPVYDDLYRRQLAEFDPVKRADLVRQMQQRFYDQVPAVILFYQDALEAYRADRFSGFPVQPDPGGVIREQNGYWGYYGAQPVAGADSGGSRDLWAVLLRFGVPLVVVGGVALYGYRRRRSREDDRE